MKESKNPINISTSLIITKDSYINGGSFAIFKGINDLIYLIYKSKYDSIICYDIKNKKEFAKIKDEIFEDGIEIKHILDIKNKRDLIMVISNWMPEYIKIYNLYNLERIVNIKYQRHNYTFSVCSINDIKDNNTIKIITCNDYDISSCNKIKSFKIYDLKGDQLNEIDQELYNRTNFIDSFNDYKSKKNFIITGEENCMNSYECENNELQLYHRYYDISNVERNYHRDIKINKEKDEIIELWNTEIRIWGFHSSKLIKKISVNDFDLYSICIWDNNYLYVGNDDKSIKLIEINSESVVKCLTGHDKTIISLEKIFISEYGECLISLGDKDDQIRMWVNENYKY